jgi:zinc/manganese transport system permease protein
LFVFAGLLRPLAIETFDPGFLRSVSRLGAPAPLIFMALLVLHLIASLHALGTLLSLGLVMIPAASARLWSDDLTRMLGLAMLFGLAASYAGLLVSHHAGLPPAAAVILAAGVLYAASLTLGGLARRRHRGRHLAG